MTTTAWHHLATRREVVRRSRTVSATVKRDELRIIDVALALLDGADHAEERSRLRAAGCSDKQARDAISTATRLVTEARAMSAAPSLSHTWAW